MELESPQWQKPYTDAQLENDPQTLQEKIALAEALILKRYHELDANGGDLEERLRLDDALDRLRTLKRTKFYFSNWESGWPRR